MADKKAPADLPLTDKAEEAAVDEASEPVDSEPDQKAPTTFELQFPLAGKDE